MKEALKEALRRAKSELRDAARSAAAAPTPLLEETLRFSQRVAELTVSLRALQPMQALALSLVAMLGDPRDLETRAMVGASVRVAAERHALQLRLLDVLRRRAVEAP